MTVRKYRSVEEAGADLILDPERGTERKLKLFFDFSIMLKKLIPHKPFPKGVHRYRSLQDRTLEDPSAPVK